MIWNTTGPAQRKGGRAGFSLLELMVVMVVLVVITTAIVPVYSSTMNALQLRNMRSEFVGLLGNVQERAVSESREYRLYIDDDNNRYWVMALRGYEDGEKIFERLTERFAEEQSLPRSVTINRIKAPRDKEQENAHYIGCYPNGASDRVEIVFESTTNGNRFKVITEGVSGEIVVEEEEG